MHPLYQARDAIEAQLLKDFLAVRRIEAVILGEYLLGGSGELPAISFPVVCLTDERDLNLARRLLSEFLDDSAGVSWRCPRCGEPVDGGLAVCWNCGAAHPDE